jgi:hypothetical protein
MDCVDTVETNLAVRFLRGPTLTRTADSKWRTFPRPGHRLKVTCITRSLMRIFVCVLAIALDLAAQTKAAENLGRQSARRLV